MKKSLSPIEEVGNLTWHVMDADKTGNWDSVNVTRLFATYTNEDVVELVKCLKRGFFIHLAESMVCAATSPNRDERREFYMGSVIRVAQLMGTKSVVFVHEEPLALLFHVRLQQA